MTFGRRTTTQLALLVIGLIVWGYGQRADDPLLRWVGIGCFAAGTVLRLVKRRHAEDSSHGPTKSD